MEENSNVVTLNFRINNDLIYHFAVSLSSTVDELKSFVASTMGIPVCNQKLIWKVDVLRDEMRTLKQYGLVHGDTVMILVCPNLQVKFERWEETGIISLSKSNFSAFPPEVWKHGSNARVLNMSHNALREVPDRIRSFTKLQKVNLTNNWIQDDSICWEGFQFLTVLSLSRNELTYLPPAIGSLRRLVQLDISYNRLDRVPDHIGQLTRLRILKASHNRIDSISPSIRTCTSLVEVDLTFNRLAELPTAFGELTELQALYLSANKLQTLPMTLFKNCLQLSTLDVNRNEITKDLLRQYEGWDEFDNRRVLRSPRKLDFSVPRSDGI